MEGEPADTTIWNGSVFDCSGNDIALIHSRFGSNPGEEAAGECNNGSIYARGVSVHGNCYTSQLNINVTSDMIGKTISCVHDTLSGVIVVGTLTVTTVGKS